MTEPITKKTWDPAIEENIRREWDNSGIHRIPKAEKYYTIDTPPPYPSGRPWHIGAAAHYSQIDMIARTARMGGHVVYFPIGIDRNGLPVEIYTEKKHKIHMRDTPRNEFLDLCRSALDELEGEMIQIMKHLGLSGDVDNRYRTDTPEYRSLTQATFIHLWNSGRIYVATRPNNYDWASGTTIADAEIAYTDLPAKLVYMKFAAGNGIGITIASTRPELLCSCRAIIVNPEDSRYRDLVGKSVTVPVFGHTVKIMYHPSAKADFGSGAVMVCSYGDQNDVALFRELDLEEVVAIGLDGRMTEAAGPYKGMRPKQARSKIIQDMQDAGIIEDIEDIVHRTPVSERSKTPIEIIPMNEYYMKQKDMVEKMRSLSSKIKFHPSMHKQILLNWLDSISIDWPISRRRYYGTEIPVWHCNACGHPNVPEPGGYYQPWKEKSPIESCTECGQSEFTGEERTFDTWMDSSISPLFVSKYSTDEKFFSKTYPAALRPQSKDIVRTWLYYTLLRCDSLTGQPPWSRAWIMGYGLDERGLKMSKSKGNAIDPLPVIKKYGADAFRLWSASEVNHGYDFRCSEQKIESTKKFLSKLWNISRFLSYFPVVADAEPTATDKWILYELDKLVERCQSGYSEYNFFVPAIAVREFTWNVFAAHYIEMVKKRARGEGFDQEQSSAALYTLHKVLSTILLLLAPITPFITEYLWKRLYHRESIHAQQHATVSGYEPIPLTDEIMKFNSTVWGMKKSKNLSLKDAIKIDVPEPLQSMERDLRAMHNLE